MTQTDPNNVDQKPSYQEDLQVMGEQLVTRVKELVHEGNIRRLIIKQDGKSLLEIPLSVGLVGGIVTVLAAPTLAAIGAIGALVSRVTIEVVRTEEPTDVPPTTM